MTQRPAAEPEHAPTLSLLHALIYPSFALITGSTLVSSIGVWMRDTTSSWKVAMAEALEIPAGLVTGAVCFGAAALSGRQFPIGPFAPPETQKAAA